MSDIKQYKYALPIGHILKYGKSEYVIEEILGRGGFGITYKVMGHVYAGNIPVDTHFAIKEYLPDICSREDDNATMNIPETKKQEIEDGLKDFINEGKRLQELCKLNHNIVNVNEVFEANGTAYYVLEYLEGGDLRKMLHNNGKPLTEQQMLELMVPIGLAVQCLHDNHMLHLDIKPDNIVMRHNHRNGCDEPVLIDFGIAAHFNNNGTPTSKTPSQGISPGYSAIEQYSNVKHFDPKLDVYSFCATCLYLLSGKDPIEAFYLPIDFVRNQIPEGVNSNVVSAIEHGMSMNNASRTSSILDVLLSFGTTDDLFVRNMDSVQESEFDTKNLDITASSVQQTPILNPVEEQTQATTVRNPSQPYSEFNDSNWKEDNEDTPQKSLLKKILIVAMIVFGISLIVGVVLLSKKCNKSKKDEIVRTDTNNPNQKEESVNKDKIINDYINNMVYVEGGTFTMGPTSEQAEIASYDNEPAHIVTLSSFHIGKTEVTQELWEAVMGSNPSRFKNAKHPVENVSWIECQEFINKLNAITGKKFRLPTEAEWEYAARGGNQSKHYKYSGSNNIDDVAWYADNSGGTTHDVATKSPNEIGIYDMSGNVCEWCNDIKHDGYSGSAQKDPQGPSNGSYRVNRGGCWTSHFLRCFVADRDADTPGYHHVILGLRLAL